MRAMAKSLQAGIRWASPPEVLLREAVRRGSRPSLPCLRYSQTASGAAGTYKAAVCTELGKPLQILNMPSKPTLASGEVRVAVHAASVNFADLLLIIGKYQEKMDPPFTPGSELAGVVTEVGAGVSAVQVGDHVASVSQTGGAFAEEIVVDSQLVVPLQSTLDSTKAASYVISYGTALMALKRRAAVQEGETVLVTAAAGATGLACVELASKLFGAKVIGACGGPEKCELVKSKGAIECIDYRKEDIRQRIKDITKGRGVDVVIDNVGGKSTIDCLKSLAFEGRLVTVGYASGDIPQIPANLLLLKSSSILGVYWGNYSYRNPQAFMETILQSTKWLHKGDISPHISQVFDLEKINEAFAFIGSRKSTGKVVIRMK